jgi:hypothetical protein
MTPKKIGSGDARRKIELVVSVCRGAELRRSIHAFNRSSDISFDSTKLPTLGACRVA